MRDIFNRHSPGVGGSYNTINVCFYKAADVMRDAIFEGNHSSNYKEVMDMNSTCYFSVDTGSSERRFSPYYFNLNERHMATDL